MIEHISLDGVIQAPSGPDEDPGYPHGGWAALHSDPAGERPSSRLTATLSICCSAAEPMICSAAFGRKPRTIPWQTV